jgi:hypothetical protein
MPPEPSLSRVRRLLAWLPAAVLLGCAAPAPLPVPAPAAPAPAVPAPAVLAPVTAMPSAPPPAPEVPARPPASEAESAVLAALAYGDRLRVLSGSELSAEVQRLGGQLPTPMTQMQTALALMQTRVPSDTQRAVLLLQRLLAQDATEARALHPLARLIAAQLAEQRRLEEQSDRQVQQLRDALRRNDQLNERLDALRAIERDRPTRTP